MSPRYFYLDIESSTESSGLSIRRSIEAAAKNVFGECGAGELSVDVLRAGDRRALLRVQGAQLRKLRASLTLGMETRSVLSSGLGGKDIVIVASRDELAAPSKVILPEPEPAPGLILPDGSINWGCPCLGGMSTGPCGSQFRDAFSCFHYSDADPKGSDCYEKFSVMQECMSHYPELYGRDDDDDELGAAIDASAAAGDASAAAGDAAPAPPGPLEAPAPAEAGDASIAEHK